MHVEKRPSVSKLKLCPTWQFQIKPLFVYLRNRVVHNIRGLPDMRTQKSLALVIWLKFQIWLGQEFRPTTLANSSRIPSKTPHKVTLVPQMQMRLHRRKALIFLPKWIGKELVCVLRLQSMLNCIHFGSLEIASLSLETEKVELRPSSLSGTQSEIVSIFTQIILSKLVHFIRKVWEIVMHTHDIQKWRIDRAKGSSQTVFPMCSLVPTLNLQSPVRDVSIKNVDSSVTSHGLVKIGFTASLCGWFMDWNYPICHIIMTRSGTHRPWCVCRVSSTTSEWGDAMQSIQKVPLSQNRIGRRLLWLSAKVDTDRNGISTFWQRLQHFTWWTRKALLFLSSNVFD